MGKKDKISTESYKGVRDFYPADQALLSYIMNTWRGVCERFGYEEYNASILEPAELYKSKGADNEEIINTQTYTFTDRGEREVTLRPEMTPTVARMVAAKRRELGFPLRWYSIPNCFRYERPQRGRLREFWQLNADLFGSASPAADAEQMQLAHALVTAFGATQSDFIIRIGSRTYVNNIIAEAGLTEEKAASLFALLDRKTKIPEEDFARSIHELGVSPASFAGHDIPDDVSVVLQLLEQAGITNAVFDPSIVRGFAYYTGIVFEVFDTHPDNNRALMGGGRYENLTSLFDDEQISGVGFGIGDETMRIFLEVRGLLPAYTPPTKVYVAVTSEGLLLEALALATELRTVGIATATDFGDKKLGDQIKNAGKHGIPWLIVVGENEIASNTFNVKNLISGGEQSVPRESLADFLNNN